MTGPSPPLFYYFHQYWIDIQDPRTKDIFLVNLQPYTFALLMASYVLFATKVGPWLMADRKPYQLRTPMLVYNIVMVTINAYYFFMALTNIDCGRRFLDVKYPDRNDMSPQSMFYLNMGFYYWMSKFADLLDTFFFVLRKKNSHITFLHLYHHTAVPIFGWMLMKVNPILPVCFLFILINSCIHTIMYSYYALSALGPGIQKYLWWKKYITQMQLAQFGICAFYGVLMVFFQQGYPQFWFWFAFTQPPFFFYMFYGFYREAYLRREKMKKHDENCINNNNRSLIDGLKKLELKTR